MDARTRSCAAAARGQPGNGTGSAQLGLGAAFCTLAIAASEDGKRRDDAGRLDAPFAELLAGGSRAPAADAQRHQQPVAEEIRRSAFEPECARSNSRAPLHGARSIRPKPGWSRLRPNRDPGRARAESSRNTCSSGRAPSGRGRRRDHAAAKHGSSAELPCCWPPASLLAPGSGHQRLAAGRPMRRRGPASTRSPDRPRRAPPIPAESMERPGREPRRHRHRSAANDGLIAALKRGRVGVSSA